MLVSNLENVMAQQQLLISQVNGKNKSYASLKMNTH